MTIHPFQSLHFLVLHLHFHAFFPSAIKLTHQHRDFEKKIITSTHYHIYIRYHIIISCFTLKLSFHFYYSLL